MWKGELLLLGDLEGARERSSRESLSLVKNENFSKSSLLSSTFVLLFLFLARFAPPLLSFRGPFKETASFRGLALDLALSLHVNS